jgi:hypothetical protein
MKNIEIKANLNDEEVVSTCIPNISFYEGKEALESEGYRIPSLEENARLRMQEGVDSEVCQNGNLVLEAAIYVPKEKKLFLTKKSPIIANAAEATCANKHGMKFYLMEPGQLEDALYDSVEITDKSIPTSRFAEEEITVYAFGKEAKDYGRFLKDAGIEEMPIGTLAIPCLVDFPFAIQGRIRGIANDGRSALDLIYNNLHEENRVLAIHTNTKIKEYALEDIKEFNNQINESETVLNPKFLKSVA